MKWPVIEKNTINLSVYDKDNTNTKQASITNTKHIYCGPSRKRKWDRKGRMRKCNKQRKRKKRKRKIKKEKTMVNLRK